MNAEVARIPSIPSLARPIGGRGQPDQARTESEQERLALLVPEAAAPRDPVAYALAFVERYEGDMPQLEHEWALLAAATLQAWRAGRHAAAMRLAAGLALPAGRRRPLAEAEPILRVGLAASRQVGDAQQHAHFSLRLGCLLFANGRHREGQRLWHAGVRLARADEGAPCPWEPLATFALVADLLEDQETARRFTEVALRARGPDDADGALAALFLRGLYARRRRDLDRAHDDFSRCVRLLARGAPATPSPQRQLFMVATQAELARVRGDDERACAYAETAIALAQAFADDYTVAALLIDQARYAYWRGRFPVARSAYHRLRDATQGAPNLPIAERGSRFLAREMASVLPAGPAHTEGWSPMPPSAVTHPVILPAPPREPLREALSGREAEVLRFVAAGLSNREIAGRLVVTPGTVKKHLEHVYTKLDAHSRTAALARAREIGLLA